MLDYDMHGCAQCTEVSLCRPYEEVEKLQIIHVGKCSLLLFITTMKTGCQFHWPVLMVF